MRIQALAHVLQSAGNIAAGHADTNAHTCCDVVHAHLVNPMQQEGLTALGGQACDRGADDCYGLFTGQLPLWSQLKHCKVQVRHRCHVRASTALAQSIDRQIGRGLEQKRPQKADRDGLVELQQMHIGFLRNFPGFLLRADLRANESQQRCVVLTEQPLDINCLGLGGW